MIKKGREVKNVLTRIHEKRIFLFLGLCFFFAGCWGQRESEIFITSLGIDYKDHHYIIYPQFVPFSNIAKQEGPVNSSYNPPIIGKGEGELLDDAAFNFYKSTQQKVSWEHIKSIVVTEQFFEHGNLNQLNDFLSRFFQFRNNMLLFGTKEPLESILETTNIFNMSSLYTIMNLPQEAIRQYSDVTPLPMYIYRRNYYEPGMTTKIPFLSVNKKNWKKGKKTYDFLEFDGYGFIANKTYVGHLNTSDIKGMQWISKNTKRLPVLIKRKNKLLGEIVLKNPKIDKKVIVKKGKPYITFNIQTDGDIYHLVSPMSVHTIEKIVGSLIKKEIEKTHEKGIQKDIDVYQLSQEIYRYHPDLWRENKRGFLQRKMIDIKVSVHISTSGKVKIR